MSDERSQEELAGGFIRVVVGGSTRNLPTLKIRAEREWKLLLAQTLGEAQVGLDFEEIRKGGDAAYQAMAPLANLATDLSVDLLLAYDKGGVLGGREFLEENADASEVYRALLKALKVAFPFVRDLRDAATEIRSLVGMSRLVGSDSSSSTNGPLPTGEPSLTSLSEVSTPNS